MARYKRTPAVRLKATGTRYYKSVITEEQPMEPIEYTYTARTGDRWDTLAHKYLGSAALWYVVARANGGLNGSIAVKPGTVIRIPRM